MIVCVCNRLNEAQVRCAAEAGAECAHSVHAHHGVKPNCGCCLDFMNEMVRETWSAARSAAE